MKIIRPLKYVIAAAAVCILCFSGNEQYMFTVLAVTPENDIVVLPEQPDESSGKCIRNKDTFKSKVKSIRLSCIILFCKLHNTDHLRLFQPVSDEHGQKIKVCDSTVIHELFSYKLPGNRSP